MIGINIGENFTQTLKVAVNNTGFIGPSGRPSHSTQPMECDLRESKRYNK